MDGSHWQDSTVRQLEIIGEAAKQFRGNCARSILTCPDGGWQDYGMCWFTNTLVSI